MKRIISFIVLMNLGLIAFGQKGDQYKYTQNLQIGKSENAQKVLDIWKDWEENRLDRNNDYFADTMTAYFASGGMVKGKADFIKSGMEYRGKLKSVKSTIFAITPLRRDEMNEDVVTIWGMDESTMADGKIETVYLNEVWWFNKDGKITEMRQWEAKPKSSK